MITFTPAQAIEFILRWESTDGEEFYSEHTTEADLCARIQSIVKAGGKPTRVWSAIVIPLEVKTELVVRLNGRVVGLE